jgi:hypothetical protein
MKQLFLFLTILSSAMIGYSQTESTIIHYKYIEDKDIINICELSDIQIQKIYCEDTLLKGKVFNFIIKEFKKGKINSTINLNITAQKQRFPFVMNGDTMFYEIAFTDNTGFGDATKSVSITFAGILKQDKFKLKIGYPGLNTATELKGKSNYSLRLANSCSDNKIKVPINKPYPILAYSPPFDTGSNVQSYCLLGEENISDWYSKFKVNHYYAIYVEIK